jgi:hypothetical protein
MKESDLPLVRGGKLPKEALPWLEEVERVFPGSTQDIIIVRNPKEKTIHEQSTNHTTRRRR